MENQSSPSQVADGKSKHIFLLAQELMDDIELSRLPAEALILKCSRLARLFGDTETQEWLEFEMSGEGDKREQYMTMTGRWTDYKEKRGYRYPLAQIEAMIAAMELDLKGTQVPALSGDSMYGTARNIMNKATNVRNFIGQLNGIKSRVLSHLHRFVSDIYYEKAFSGLAGSIFDQYKIEVDILITSQCGDVIRKLPYIYDRLAEGDSESVSQALTTCRRVIDGFADAIYPPTEETVESEGNTLSLGAERHQNRINAYIMERTDSKSRRQRLRQTLANLYGRVSVGVHSEVTAEEARALFLSTYLFLGEVLTLKKEAA